MRALLIVAALALFSGCTLIQRGTELVEEGTALVREAKAAYVTAKAEADTNKDGKTDSQEWLAWLLGSLGLGGGGILIRNAKSNARKDQLEAEQKRLDDRLAKLET